MKVSLTEKILNYASVIILLIAIVGVILHVIPDLIEILVIAGLAMSTISKSMTIRRLKAFIQQ